LNEAISQLAERYLKAAQDETGGVIDPERYQLELQRAKAHFAVNQAYGVDLNRTAVELAEVSLWLNSMHEDLQAPWFGARLRSGNSLIGARRATYTTAQVKGAVWTGKNAAAPTETPIAEVPLGNPVGIHHFLVPGQGWGAASSAKEVKELAPDWAAAVDAWRKSISVRPTRTQLERFERLAEQVEKLWLSAAHEVEAFWQATRQHVDVWGAETPPTGARFGEAAIRQVLGNPQSASFRLRTLMDAWCSLWLWAPENGTQLPSLDQWLAAAEAVTRIDEPWHPDALFGDERELPLPSSSSLNEILDAHPWLRDTSAVAATQNWFHWELEFCPVFARGGFDLQVGNPPWVRPRWSDEDALAEHDPWFGITDPIPEKERVERRSTALRDQAARMQYVNERTENAALNDVMGAATREPLLVGQQNNLYLLFITGTWRRMRRSGVIGLLHPEGHLTDPKARTLRARAYRHYREHFHFTNELKLFGEIHKNIEYAVNIYGGDRGTVSFTQAAFLLHPGMVDRSMAHDGSGDLPGRKLPTGGWDVRPHRERLVDVSTDTLEFWAALLAYQEAASTPLVRSVTSAEAAATEAIARYPHRLAATKYFWTPGFHEQTAPRQGLIQERTDVPASWDEVILQGPHFGICNPFAKQPRPSGRNNRDYEEWDLETLPESVIPRTNWQRVSPRGLFDKEIAKWDGVRNTERYRVIVRRQVPLDTVRSVFAALLPPKPMAVSVCYLGGLSDDSATVAFAGLLGSLLVDFFVRTTGSGDLHDNIIARFPVAPTDHPLTEALVHRTLRLNCLTREFARLWESLVSSHWTGDEFTAPDTATISLASPPVKWTIDVPARRDLDRWLLLCELDALSALILGVAPTELEAVYRSQFPVLQGYEHQMLFDANGRQLCGDWHQHGYLQAQLEAAAKATKKPGWRKIWDRVQDHLAGDSEVDLGPFVPPFRPADRVATMTHAYWSFVDRYDLAPSEGVERTAA
jgi:hypothetical protein